MYDFHKNKEHYFNMQFKNSDEYIVPFIQGFFDFNKTNNVLEIGCAEGGVLKAFTNRNQQCIGIELSETRTDLARKFMQKEVTEGKIKFISRNIYDIDIDNDLGVKFDLIILKDVIEHIHDQEKFMSKVGEFLNPDGKIFFGFPPWQMPFGGHQQLCESKALKYLPYFHMLPMPLFKGLMKLVGESQKSINTMVEIKETGISLERFNRILKSENFVIDKKMLYFINPIYKFKFGLKPRKQLKIIESIPVLRNFISTCAYYIVSKNK